MAYRIPNSCFPPMFSSLDVVCVAEIGRGADAVSNLKRGRTRLPRPSTLESPRDVNFDAIGTESQLDE